MGIVKDVLETVEKANEAVGKIWKDVEAVVKKNAKGFKLNDLFDPDGDEGGIEIQGDDESKTKKARSSILKELVSVGKKHGIKVFDTLEKAPSGKLFVYASEVIEDEGSYFFKVQTSDQ